jgi:hypothetical protein
MGRKTRGKCAGGKQKLPIAQRLHAGIMVHRYTSEYIKMNEVETRLGANIEVLAGYALTISQKDIRYTSRHPHPSLAPRCRSQ